MSHGGAAIGAPAAIVKVHAAGTPAAFMTPEFSWVWGAIAQYDGRSRTYTCRASDPEPVTIDRIMDTAEQLWVPQPESIEEDVDDLLLLTELHEASLLLCLKRRYLRDVVYTNIGHIVVAINPFNYNISWYRDEKMEDYLLEGVMIEKNLPHSWAVAHNTYKEMVEYRNNHAILISGESGAGKTEAAKIVLKYLGALSTRLGTLEQQEACLEVSKRVLASSPILEAFGNAKTVRNDNSSRFGKFATIQFDRAGFLVGCFVTRYLLEKSRIITAASNERVYHSFYQLAQSSIAKEFALRNPKIYRILSTGGTLAIDGVDDAAEYDVTKQAMTDIGLSEAEQTSIWRVVAGVLFLQNVDFTETEERDGRVAKIDPNLAPVVSRACELWDITEEEFRNELVSSLIVTKREQVLKPLSKAAAQDTRDSISKSMYNWLFDWLVHKINETTDCGAHCDNWIGLLDIFGFENFQRNSFEQLCINLANETLQDHYNLHVFSQDMKECRDEGIDTAEVHFVDNKPCIELLVGKIGVFTLLDEECAVSGNERNYLAKLVANFGNQKGSEAKSAKGESLTGKPSQYFGVATGKAIDNHFRIRHYAAVVQYCVDGFLDKNRDALKEPMRAILRASRTSLIASLVPAAPDEGSRNPSSRATVGSTFLKQLNDLMGVIGGAVPHWIRCIKPHPNKVPRQFSHKLVMSQLRSAGVLDTVTVRKAGYPIRIANDAFVQRYRVLLKHGGSGSGSHSPNIAARGHRRITGEEIRREISHVFSVLNITKETGQLGKSKVFLRQAAFLKLNHARDECMLQFGAVIQAVGRGCLCRYQLFRAYLVVHRQRILEEKRYREEQERIRQHLEEERRQREREERDRLEREEKLKIQRAAVEIQRRVRGHLARRLFATHYLDICRAKEEHLCDDALHLYRSYVASSEKRLRMISDRNLVMEKLRARGETKLVDSDRRRERLREHREEAFARIAEERRRVDAMIRMEVKAEMQRRRVAERTSKAESFAYYDAKCAEKHYSRMNHAHSSKIEEERHFQEELKSLLDSHSVRVACDSVAGTESDSSDAHSRFAKPGLLSHVPLRDAAFLSVKRQWTCQEEWGAERETLCLATEIDGRGAVRSGRTTLSTGGALHPSVRLSAKQRFQEEAFRVDTVEKVLQHMEAAEVLRGIHQEK